MAIKKYGPTTPGRRGMTVTDYSVLSKVAPERSLLEPMKKHSGRNNTGRITVRHQGGGNRTKYRVIDFKRQKTDMPATVKTLEYDPNRSAFIALVEYTDGVKSYIIAPDGLKVGDVIVSSKSADITPGNCLPFENIPVGTIIHNIELYPGRGAQLVRSAGNMAQLMAKENGYALVRLHLVRCATCPSTAPQSSVRSPTSTTRTSTSARLAVSATWASVPAAVVPS